MNKLVHLAFAAALIGAAAPAMGATTFYATLTNGAETPAVDPSPRPASFGEGIFVLNDAQTELSYSVNIFNIDVTGAQTPDTALDNLTAAHFHGGNATAQGTRPVVFGFFGSPFNNTNPNDGVVTPFASGVGGLFTGVWNAPEGNNTTLGAQLFNLFNGRVYINFHTVQFGGGEIRGTLNVPEPATWAMMISGFALAGLALRRRRRPAIA